jgi:penicillin-binding protein 1A
MILNYALAFEYLNYNSQETLLDIETTYPNSDISIKNSDNKFEGEMNIAKAVGYSKNTTAINFILITPKIKKDYRQKPIVNFMK